MANNKKKIEVWKHPDGSFSEIGRVEQKKSSWKAPVNYELIRVVFGESVFQTSQHENPVLEVLYQETYRDWTVAQLDDYVRKKHGNQPLHLRGRPLEGGIWHWHRPPKMAKYARNDEQGEVIVQVLTRVQKLEEENARLRTQVIAKTETVIEVDGTEKFVGWVKKYFMELMDTMGEPMVRNLLDTVVGGVAGPVIQMMQPNMAQGTNEQRIADAPADGVEIPDVIWNELVYMAQSIDWNQSNIPAIAAMLRGLRTNPDVIDNPMVAMLIKFKENKAA